MCKSPEPSRSCIQRDRWKLHAPRPPHTFCTWTTSPFRFGPQALQSWLPKRRLHWKRPRKWSQGRQPPESFAPANSFEKNSPMARGMKTVAWNPVAACPFHCVTYNLTVEHHLIVHYVHHDLPDSCDCVWNVFLGFSGCLVASITGCLWMLGTGDRQPPRSRSCRCDRWLHPRPSSQTRRQQMAAHPPRGSSWLGESINCICFDP